MGGGRRGVGGGWEGVGGGWEGDGVQTLSPTLKSHLFSPTRVNDKMR